jgi:hypothetical protein
MNSTLKLGSLRLHQSAVVLALGLSGVAAFGAGTASDTASNYTSGGWNNTPSNYGSGFGAWSVALNNAYSPPYVGTYLDTGAPVVSGGYAFATYANGGGNNGSISIDRAFTAGTSGSTSLYDQAFSVNLSSGGVGNGSGGPPNSELSVGVGTAFSFSYLGTGSDNFLFSVDGATPISTTVNFSQLNAGINISLAVSGALNSPSEGYTLTVSSLSASVLYTTSGTFDSSAYNTSYFSYLDSNTANNNYFNSLNLTPEATPEPSTMLLSASGLAVLLLFRRRR